MFLSKRPSNGVYYLWYFDDLGKKCAVSTRCKLKADALRFLQTFKRTEQERKVRLQRVSLSHFIADYQKHTVSVHTIKTQRSSRTALAEFLRVVGDVPLHRIGVREIERFLSTKKAEASDWTARKYFIAIASAFETAKRWNLIAANPFRLVERPKVREVQPAFFSKPDLQKVLEHIADHDFRELCICAVSTGLRSGELRSLEWTAVDFIRKVITVSNSETFTTKSKKGRVVPMSETLWKMLATRKERASCELVFHRQGRQLSEDYVSKTFKASVCDAKLNDKLHFHSLRHTFASWLVQDGASLYEVQKLLGHSSSKVTEIYSHLQPEQLHSTVNRIAVTLN